MRIKAFFAAAALLLLAAGTSNAMRIVNYADPRTAAKNIRDIIDAMDTKTDFKPLLGNIDAAIHLLRGPIPGGQGYQFARVIQDDSTEPVTIGRAKVNVLYDAKPLMTVSGAARSVHKLEINAPKHRGFFKNNGDTYVDSYTLTYVLGGKVFTETREVKSWVRNGETYPIFLPGLVESASVDITVGALASDLDRTSVEIVAISPNFEDKRESPYNFAVEQLLKAKEIAAAGGDDGDLRDKLANALQSLNFLPLDEETDKKAAPSASEIVRELENILFLLNGATPDVEQAKKKLEAVIELLR